MTARGISDQITEARQLSEWLHARLNGRAMPGSDRARVAIALFQHSLDIADATTVLIAKNLPGPALVLARPLVESYARGLWALWCAEEHEIRGFVDKGRSPPRLKNLVSQLASQVPAEAKWVERIAEGLDALHDLAHGGRLHVLGRVGTSAVEPKYPEEDVKSLVGMGIEVQIRSGAELIGLMGDETAMEELANHSMRFDRDPGRMT